MFQLKLAIVVCMVKAPHLITFYNVCFSLSELGCLCKDHQYWRFNDMGSAMHVYFVLRINPAAGLPNTTGFSAIRNTTHSLCLGFCLIFANCAFIK